ncbi:MFS transporter [Streptomyces celluloflavus]|uniref:MFS transporter n=1 Tax=Streptomyces celluloflavus TaxID=58344 RepID=UPI003667AFA1
MTEDVVKATASEPILRHRPFRLLATGALLSGFGDQVASVGYLIVAYGLTGSKSETTLMVVIQVLPYLLFGLLGGAVSSFLPRVRLMVSVDVARFILQLLLGVLALTGLLSLPIMLVSIFLIETGGCFFNPCSRAALVDFVPQERLISANAALSIGQNISRLLGPLAAAAITLLGSGAVFFFVDALTYLLSVAALLILYRSYPVRVDLRIEHREEGLFSRTWTALREFYGSALRDPVLVILFATTFVTVLFNTWSWNVGLFFKMAPDPDSGKLPYTLTLSLFALISILASIGISRLFQQLTLPFYATGVVLWGLGLAWLGLSDDLTALVAAVCAIAVGLTMASQSRVYLLQSRVSAVHVGQAFSASAVLLYFGDTASLSGFGVASESVGTGTLMVWSGFGVVAAGVICAVFLSVRRRRDATASSSSKEL